jgi:hypothetical protein
MEYPSDLQKTKNSGLVILNPTTHFSKSYNKHFIDICYHLSYEKNFEEKYFVYLIKPE